MAIDALLKFEGKVTVEGESRQEGHEKEIEIDSYSWGVHNTGSTHSGKGSGTGKGDFSDMTVSCTMEKSIALLMMCCAQGDHFDKVTLTSRRVGGDKKVEYLKITLDDVLISSLSIGASGGSEGASVSLSLNFGEIEVEYTPQNPDGTKGKAVTHGYKIPEGVKK
jgi:type VI secretion system secreted protein Hcp